MKRRVAKKREARWRADSAKWMRRQFDRHDNVWKKWAVTVQGISFAVREVYTVATEGE